MTDKVKSHGWVREDALEQRLSQVVGRQAQCFAKGELRVIVTQELQTDGVQRMHLSISHKDEKRYPTWEEIKDARYALMPMGCMVAQLLPPPNDYVNIRQNCFHLYEIVDPRVEQ